MSLSMIDTVCIHINKYGSQLLLLLLLLLLPIPFFPLFIFHLHLLRLPTTLLRVCHSSGALSCGLCKTNAVGKHATKSL